MSYRPVGKTNISSFLTGKVAGLQITKTSSGTGGSSAITVRGVRSLKGGQPAAFCCGWCSNYQYRAQFGGYME